MKHKQGKGQARWSANESLPPSLSSSSASVASAPMPLASSLSSAITNKVRRTIYLTAIARLLLGAVDALIAVTAFPLAFWLYHGTPVLVWPDGALFPADVTNSFMPYLSLALVLPAVRVFLLNRYGLYRLRGEFSMFGDVTALLKAVTVSTLVIVLFAFLYRGGFVYRDYSYSRMVFVIDWAIALVALGAVRTAVRAVQFAYRRNERNLIPTIIVGEGELAKLCVQEIAENTKLGYRVIGAVSAKGESEALAIGDTPVLGTFDNLPALIRQYGIEEILITDTELSPQRLFEAIMRSGRTHQINFRVVPNMFNCLPRKTDVAQIGSLPMITLFTEPLTGPSRFLKRSLDILGALTAIGLTGPVWLVLAYLIKRESPGPVFKAQERVGMDGKIFPMIKFRSMRADADSPEQVAAHIEAMRRNITGEVKEGSLHGKVENDPRITRIGEFMRRYSLDELPQMINVLRGEMSLIGPRPPIPYEVEMYDDWHRARFHVKPGLTGLWQVSGRNRLKFEEMVRLDVYYIENWSIWLDVKILLKTLPVVLRGDNTN